MNIIMTMKIFRHSDGDWQIAVVCFPNRVNVPVMTPFKKAAKAKARARNAARDKTVSFVPESVSS